MLFVSHINIYRIADQLTTNTKWNKRSFLPLRLLLHHELPVQTHPSEGHQFGLPAVNIVQILTKPQPPESIDVKACQGHPSYLRSLSSRNPLKLRFTEASLRISSKKKCLPSKLSNIFDPFFTLLPTPPGGHPLPGFGTCFAFSICPRSRCETVSGRAGSVLGNLHLVQFVLASICVTFRPCRRGVLRRGNSPGNSKQTAQNICNTGVCMRNKRDKRHRRVHHPGLREFRARLTDPTGSVRSLCRFPREFCFLCLLAFKTRHVSPH